MQVPPLGLYIHIPWCVKKCPYCDFNSHESNIGETGLPEAAYLKALLEDLESELTHFDVKREISSVFIGGGTPSLLSGNFYQALFEQLRSRLSFSGQAEITIEANPGAVDEANFAGIRAAGVNRLSLGAQSFSNASLKRLGRIHDSESIYRAYRMARSSGFDNINIDLMHGLPGQTLVDGLADLDAAFALAPEHISWYQLTIERNTVFYNRPPTLPIEDIIDELFLQGLTSLQNAGYLQYEVSAFARVGRQSAHNKNYWQFGDYIGIGAGAHGKLSNTLSGYIERRWKTRAPQDYMQARNKLAGSNIIAVDELPLEFMMNALRLSQGFSADLFEQRTGLAFAQVQTPIAALREKGLMEQHSEYYRPTQKGRLFLNDVIAVFSET